MEAWRSTGCLFRDANFANSVVQQAHTVYPIKTDIILLQGGSLASSTAQSLGEIVCRSRWSLPHVCLASRQLGSKSTPLQALAFLAPTPFRSIELLYKHNCSLCCLSGAHLGLTAVCSLLCRAAPKRSSLLRLHGRRRQASVRSHLTDFVYQALASARRDLFGRCLGTTTKTTIPPYCYS